MDVDDAIVVIVLIFIVVSATVMISIGRLGGLPSLVRSDSFRASIVCVLNSVPVRIISCPFDDDLNRGGIAAGSVAATIGDRRNGVGTCGFCEIQHHFPRAFI